MCGARPNIARYVAIAAISGSESLGRRSWGLVVDHDLILGLLQLHHLAELVQLAGVAFANDLGRSLEQTEDLRKMRAVVCFITYWRALSHRALVARGRHHPGATGSFVPESACPPLDGSCHTAFFAHRNVFISGLNLNRSGRASALAFVAPKREMKIFFLGMFVGEASTLLFNFVIWPAVKPMLFNSFIGLELKPLLDLFS